MNQLTFIYDRNQENLFRLIYLIQREPLFLEQLKKVIPSPEQLFSKAHLEIAYAFTLIRNGISIEQYMRDYKKMIMANAHAGDRMEETEKEKETTEMGMEMEVEMEMEMEKTNDSSKTPSSEWSPFRPAFLDVFQSYFAPDTWKSLSLPCALLFWCLQCNDMSKPRECYENAISHFQQEIKVLESSLDKKADKKADKKVDKEADKKERRKVEKQIAKIKQEVDTFRKDEATQAAHVNQWEVNLR